MFMLGSAAGINKTDAAIEDFLGDKFYLDCVNAAFGVAIKDSDLPVDGSDMIAKRVESVLGPALRTRETRQTACDERATVSFRSLGEGA